ncbi:serine/threonine-protein kinase pim-3-like [Puntigrus tetrazona]|nr:serine/threonine-protein kinase pim-3-like [Puntigrus tetrazona]
MRQAVLAAKHCLDRGVFHRDIKSDNILVNTETLQLKLIDFGCGKLLETSEELKEGPAVRATVKSLGVLLFRMVNGISFVDLQMIPSSTLSSEISGANRVREKQTSSTHGSLHPEKD